MRHAITFCCFVWLTVLGSCEKATQNTNIKNGTYKGTFQRTPGNTSGVTLALNNGAYSGTSEVARYPAICNGNYKLLNKDEINFENACIWTAEFDWTLILNGNYQFKVIGDSLQISRQYPWHKDIYFLKRER